MNQLSLSQRLLQRTTGGIVQPDLSLVIWKNFVLLKAAGGRGHDSWIATLSSQAHMFYTSGQELPRSQTRSGRLRH